jgi:hypothetical protein
VSVPRLKKVYKGEGLPPGLPNLPDSLWVLLRTCNALEELCLQMHDGHFYPRQIDNLFSLRFPHLLKFSIASSSLVIKDTHYPHLIAFFRAHPLLQDLCFAGDFYRHDLPSNIFPNARKLATMISHLLKFPDNALRQLEELEVLVDPHSDTLHIPGQVIQALELVKGVRRLKLSVRLEVERYSGDLIQWALRALPMLEELEVFAPFHVGVFSIVCALPSLYRDLSYNISC